MEEIKGWESWPGWPQRLHTRVRRDYVLAFGSFFQRMGLRDVPLWRLGPFSYGSSWLWIV
jgi:hypothetical protein